MSRAASTMSKAALLGLISLGLAGCAQIGLGDNAQQGTPSEVVSQQPTQRPNAQQPSTPAAQPSFGLYQLDVAPDANGQLMAHVRPFAAAQTGDSALSAQSTELTGIRFAPTAAQVTTENDGSKTYTMPLSATNNSGQTIARLHVVPVAVSSNQNNTFFRNAMAATGGPADPTGISLIAGSDDQWRSMLSPALLRAADFRLPSGVTFSRYHDSAWTLGSELANGQTGTLTLKFGIPAGNDTYRFSFVFGAFDIPTTSNNLVISALYGAGGNSGATYNRDFVELHNPTKRTISLGGLSLQYASASGTNWGKVELPNVTLSAGQYYLVELSGGINGSALPTTPDLASTSINMSGTTGKLALVNGTTALSAGTTPTNIAKGDLAAGYSNTPSQLIDLVGFGTADSFEAAKAPAPSTTNLIVRQQPCADSDNNSTDFEAVDASSYTPKNSASALNICP